VKHDRENEYLSNALPAALQHDFAVMGVPEDGPEIRRFARFCIRDSGTNRKNARHRRLNYQPELEGTADTGDQLAPNARPHLVHHFASSNDRDLPFIKGIQAPRRRPVGGITSGPMGDVSFGMICGQCSRTASTRTVNATPTEMRVIGNGRMTLRPSIAIAA